MHMFTDFSIFSIFDCGRLLIMTSLTTNVPFLTLYSGNVLHTLASHRHVAFPTNPIETHGISYALINFLLCWAKNVKEKRMANY